MNTSKRSAEILPEMPDASCQRYKDEFGLSEYDANLLTLENHSRLL